MSALVIIVDAALAVANVSLAAEALGVGLQALHEPGNAADAIAAACAKFSSPPPPHMLCACGADWRFEGCLCRLLVPHVAQKPPPAKTRDFTDGFEVGQHVRLPKGEIARCQKCGRHGVAVKVPRWRYKPAHTNYIHAAEVQSGMVTVLDCCTVEKAAAKRRRAPRAARQDGAS
jgi:hypothetical protein